MTAPTLVHALQARAQTAPEAVAFQSLRLGASGDDEVWSWGRWRNASLALARALAAEGTAPVAILAGAGPLWPVADLAAQWAGRVSVGLYPTASPEQTEEVLMDCAATTLFVDADPGRREVARTAAARVPAVRVVEPEAMASYLEKGVGEEDPAPPAPEADAVLIYTSGSTGVPKGARLTHRTLVASAASVADTLGLRPEDTTLSFLPYAHAAERVFGLATRVVTGMQTTFVADPARLFEVAAAVQPTVFGGLPRVYEKVYEAAVEAGGGADADGAFADPDEARRAVRRLVGERVRIATSGGAPLPPPVARGLEALGLPVLGAYGLTEHLCCTFNRPDDYTFDSVGRPMPGTELRIAGDGEILVRRSDLTFRGYLGRPSETAAAFTEDGQWLRTGDVGQLDGEGRLRVTGRRKELLVLSTGKNVAPLPIEGWLTEKPWIEQAVLVGEGKKYVSALLVLRRPLVERWAAARGLRADWPELVDHATVRGEVERQVAEVNQRVSRSESVRRFHILPSGLSVEGGELTPTLKVRRDVVTLRHAEAIATLYASGAETPVSREAAS